MSDILGYLDGKQNERSRLELKIVQLEAELAQSRAEKRDLQVEIERLRAVSLPDEQETATAKYLSEAIPRQRRYCARTQERDRGGHA